MRVLLLTHKPDIDGVAPVILSKFVFSELDYILLETFETNSIILEFVNDQVFDNYDKVYITDLSIDKDICEMINLNQILRNKIKIFDHHHTHLFVNEYDFGTSIDIDSQGTRQSGTSLYYQHLLEMYDNTELKKESIMQFVELVRQYDTWEWFEKKNIDAKKLTDLFEIFGGDYFIKYFYKFLKTNDSFYYTEKNKYLLEVEQERIKRYIEEKSYSIIPIVLCNYNVGLVFSENYRSELGSALAIKFKQEYDFIILINLDRSVSYRGVKNIDLGGISKIFGGNGHVNSSSSPLSKSIQNKVIQSIFKEKVVINRQTIIINNKERIKNI